MSDVYKCPCCDEEWDTTEDNRLIPGLLKWVETWTNTNGIKDNCPSCMDEDGKGTWE